MNKNRILILILIILLTACGTAKPVADIAEATVAPLTTPTAAATPTAAEAEATVAVDELATFVDSLKTAVQNQDYPGLQTLMSASIAVGAWRSEWRLYEPDQLIADFQNAAAPAPLSVQFSDLTAAEIGSLIDQPPASLLGPTANVVATLHSSGWGQSASDEAILLITEANGSFAWSAFLYTNGSFADASLGTVAAPIGLIYHQVGEGVFQIDATGTPRLLLDEETATIANIKIAPDGKHAAYIDETNRLWLLDTDAAEGQPLAEDYAISFLQWGNNETLLVGIWLDPNEADGPNNGHISSIDIKTGAVQILDETRLSSGRPTLAADGKTVAFDVFPSSQTDGETGRVFEPSNGLQTFDRASFTPTGELLHAPLFNPAWSGSGTQLAWLTSSGDRFALQVYDLQAKTAVQLHDWDPARFGGLVPSPMWSPNGQWIALEILANGAEGSGLWLIATDGTETRLISPQATNPHWFNDELLVFSVGDGPRLYDLNSDALLKMDLPANSIFVTLTPVIDLITGLHPVTDTPVAYIMTLQDVTIFSGPGESYDDIGGIFDGQTALVTGQSQDGMWWRVICPDDSIGDCWVLADEAFTVPVDGDSSSSELPDPATVPLAVDLVEASPDGQWKLKLTRTEPLTRADEQLYFTTLSVTNDEVVWTPVSEWRPFGLGHTTPQAVRWSEDGHFLYYANISSPDGCAIFVNGGDLWRLDLINGEVAELAPYLGLVMDLSPDATRLAVNASFGRGFLIRDLITGEEQSISLPNAGEGWQMGGLKWSPDGEMLLLTQIINPCSQASTNAIVRIDVETMMATTLVEEVEHTFRIIEWIGPDEVRLQDDQGRNWFVDVFSGELATEN